MIAPKALNGKPLGFAGCPVGLQGVVGSDGSQRCRPGQQRCDVGHTMPFWAPSGRVAAERGVRPCQRPTHVAGI